MNRLPDEMRTRVIAALVEGVSIRGAHRMTGVAARTIHRLLQEIGNKCEVIQNDLLRNLPCRWLQCDELWTFCHAKRKNLPKKFKGKFGYGNVWVWTAIDQESGLIPCWTLGHRDSFSARRFANNLAARLSVRPHITTDDLSTYRQAFEWAFGRQLDYACVTPKHKSFQANEAYRVARQTHGGAPRAVFGNPDLSKAHTQHIESNNGKMRSGISRLHRSTNAFSKKPQNLNYHLAIYFAYHNFVRAKKRSTPAMRVGVTDHVWTVGELLAYTPARIPALEVEVYEEEAG